MLALLSLVKDTVSPDGDHTIDVERALLRVAAIQDEIGACARAQVTDVWLAQYPGAVIGDGHKNVAM